MSRNIKHTAGPSSRWRSSLCSIRYIALIVFLGVILIAWGGILVEFMELKTFAFSTRIGSTTTTTTTNVNYLRQANQTPFSSEATTITTTTVNNNNNNAAAPFAVFYNVYMPSDNAAVEVAIAEVKEQIQQIRTSYAASLPNQPLNLFYNTIGNQQVFNAHNITSICSQHPNLLCHHMDHYDSGFEEVTLDKAYDYCQRDGTKSHWIIYLHNKGSYHNPGWEVPEYKLPMNQGMWRSYGTDAATHEQCLGRRHWDDTADDACNVCGLLWTPIPAWSHFPGNFFSACCSYVQKLLRPSHYQTLHQHLLKETYIPMVETGKMIAFKKFLMGGDRWSMEMWVGSHPSVHPCDVSTKPDIGYWLVKDRNTQDEFHYSLIPRKDRTMRDYVTHSEPKYDVETVLDNEKHRYKDYNLLGGMLTRFRLMYAKMPLDTSWMWSFYPDGQVWKEGLKQYGQDNVYEKVAAQYFDPISLPTPAPIMVSTVKASTVSASYDPKNCQNMMNGHCQDQGGGAWSYRKPDGTCAHTEADAPRDRGAIASLHGIFPNVTSVLDFGGGLGPYLIAFRGHAHQLVTMEPHDLEGCIFQGVTHDPTDLANTPLDRLPTNEYDLAGDDN